MLPDSADGGDRRRGGSPELQCDGFFRGPHDPKVAGGARYRMMSPARLPIMRSPFLTIPPSFSPSALVVPSALITNLKAEPSPTNCTFFMSSVFSKTVASDTSPSTSNVPDRSAFDNGCSGYIEFKPHFKPSLNSALPCFGTLAFVDPEQRGHEPSVQIQSQNQTHILESSQSVKKAEKRVFSSHAPILSAVAPNPPFEPIVSEAISPTEVIDGLQQAKGLEGTQAPLSKNECTSLVVAEKSSEDGYNWRKYGQKYVIGYEFPLSYYKCMHTNCQMKKQLERSHDGKATEVIYKGQHSHPKPQHGSQLAVGAIICGPEKSSSGHRNVSHQVDPNGIQELSSSAASDDDEEAGGEIANHPDEAAVADDPESKRRKMDAVCRDATSLGKAIRESRVVVQTISEVDILDDGYKWRKYGQKVVKGNPNPRSYYKCTNAGCAVRKHVERASHDPSAVLNTYEGKHNHDVPAARTTGQGTSTLTDTGGSNALNSHTSATLSSMLRTCDMRLARDHYAQRAESDTIILSLGVGVTSNQGSAASNKQQGPEIDHNHQAHLPRSDYSK